MVRVVITGGPGVGKTTLLGELAAMDHAVVDESARAVIRERLTAGLPPRPDPQAFAAELLRRDRIQYDQTAQGPSPVFFDRCLVESLAMALECGLLSQPQADAQLRAVHFHPVVFILPPWQAIDVNDAERDHDFVHCERVHALLCRWYGRCGYRLHAVPRVGPRQRAGHELRVLAEGGAGPSPRSSQAR